MTSWCTLLVDGFPVGVVFKDGFELLDGKDPKTGTRFHLDKMVDVYLYLPAEVYGRKEEIVELVGGGTVCECERAQTPMGAWCGGRVDGGAPGHRVSERAPCHLTI